MPFYFVVGQNVAIFVILCASSVVREIQNARNCLILTPVLNLAGLVDIIPDESYFGIFSPKH